MIYFDFIFTIINFNMRTCSNFKNFEKVSMNTFFVRNFVPNRTIKIMNMFPINFFHFSFDLIKYLYLFMFRIIYMI